MKLTEWLLIYERNGERSLDTMIKADSEYYYKTSDLIIIAFCAALGGLFSTFIGYISYAFAQLTPIPQGGGQVFAGLHIFWLVLASMLTKKKGSALLTAIIKGFIEFFTGSKFGIMIVFISSIEGVIFELLVISLFIVKFETGYWKKIIIMIAAGLSGVSAAIINIGIKYNFELPLELIFLISALAFISCLILGGFLGINISELFLESGILNWRPESDAEVKVPDLSIIRVTSISIVVLLSIASVIYLIGSYLP